MFLILFKTNKVKKIWKKLLNCYDSVYPGYSKNLNKGISKLEFENFENQIGVKLSPQMKELYQINNGDSGEFIAGSILGLNFLSTDGILEEWNHWRETLESLNDSDLDNLNSSSISVIPNKIKCKYINLKWIPIADDSAGNHIGIDMDPDSEGKIGQIINFGRDEDKKIVIANSLYEFIEKMVEVIQSDEFELEDFDGENVFVLDGHSHAIDYFKSKFNL